MTETFGVEAPSLQVSEGLQAQLGGEELVLRALPRVVSGGQ